MSVDWNMLLTAWVARPIPILILIGMITLYVRGKQAMKVLPEGHSPWRFYLSLFAFGFAWLSPIDTLTPHFFFMHVAQHLLLISLFPATFMGSETIPILMEGLPPTWKARIETFLEARVDFFRWLTPKGGVWFFFIAAVWITHDTLIFRYTVEYRWVAHIALMLMMIGGLLHWWHVTSAYPRIHKPLPGFSHMGYTLMGAAPLKIPGLFFLFSIFPWYGEVYPTQTFLGNEISPLLSQQIGGILIWTFGGVVYTITAMTFLSNWIGQEEAKPERPRHEWDNEETFIAPHLENRRR